MCCTSTGIFNCASMEMLVCCQYLPITGHVVDSIPMPSSDIVCIYLFNLYFMCNNVYNNNNALQCCSMLGRKLCSEGSCFLAGSRYLRQCVASTHDLNVVTCRDPSRGRMRIPAVSPSLFCHSYVKPRRKHSCNHLQI